MERPERNPTGQKFDLAIALLIVANAIAVILESLPEIWMSHAVFLERFEFFSLIAFMIEYVLRVWVCVENARYRHPLLGRLRYMLTPMAIVDFLAFAPMLFLSTTMDLRILRVVRLLSILKLVRSVVAIGILLRVIRREASVLGAALLVLMMLVVLSAAVLYWVEGDVQPHAFGSIPAAMWWAIVTLTTVGYGDVVPQTMVGKLLSGLIVVLGVGIAALPAGIIAAGFTRELETRRESYRLAAKKALEDGMIDEGERHTLERLRKELDLGRDEVDQLIKEAAGSRRPRQCPHCGKPIDLE